MCNPPQVRIGERYYHNYLVKVRFNMIILKLSTIIEPCKTLPLALIGEETSLKTSIECLDAL